MLVISNVEHLLMYVGHLYAFFRKMSIQVLCPFPNQVICFALLLSCMGSLYILGINPLSDPCFIDFFSTPFRCLFIILSPWLFFFLILLILYTSFTGYTPLTLAACPASL